MESSDAVQLLKLAGVIAETDSDLGVEAVQTHLNSLFAQLATSSVDGEPWQVRVDKTGMNSTVFIVTKGSDNLFAVKHATNGYSAAAVVREQEKLAKIVVKDQTLSGPRDLLPFPAPLGSLREPHRNLAVSKCLDGINGAEAFKHCKDASDRLGLVRAFARAIRQIHDTLAFTTPEYLRIELHPAEHPQSNRDWLISLLTLEYTPKTTAKANRILASESASADDKESAQSALAQLANLQRLADRPATDSVWSRRSQLVLTHGDSMIPNMLFARSVDDGTWEACGVVDWGDCGYADPRYDVQTGLWSIRYNTCVAVMAPELGEWNAWAREKKRIALLIAKAAGPEIEAIKETKEWKGVVDACEEAERTYLDAYGMDKEELAEGVFADAYDLFDYYCYDE
ncbi:kinase-like domain-containing protein [Chytriomyces sp. MP71]|nr:kinase-like domain-containing protein [Chytriomyces sp. MP71]